jgi:DNA-binding LytR/AlgR family response regulator
MSLIINFQIITVIVGVFPMAFLVLLRYRQQSVVYDRGAGALNNRITEQPNADLGSNEKSSSLADQLTNLLAIEAADNYVTEYWHSPKGVRQNLVRVTMKMIEERPDLPPTMMRCHRSWFVNLDHVERVSGNAQGYRLHLPHGLEVPVARTRSAELERRLPHRSPLRPK